MGKLYLPPAPGSGKPTIWHSKINAKSYLKKKIEKKQLLIKLAKYGITQDEWDEIEKYKGSSYFIPSTLLHKISLFDYKMPNYGNVLENDSWLKPEKAIASYCKIYSAMCKFAKRYNKQILIERVCSELYRDEMTETGLTSSLLSFSKKGVYQLNFEEDKIDPLLLSGTLMQGIPCIVFSEFVEDPIEDEVLIPPFLNIRYERNNSSLNNDNYTHYVVEISNNSQQKLSDEEKDRMLLLEEIIKTSNIPNNYYNYWYKCKREGCEINYSEKDDLETFFFNWQESFKEYLNLRFREIQYEINHPQLKSSDFLSWAITRGQRGISRFKEKMEYIKGIFSFEREEER